MSINEAEENRVIAAALKNEAYTASMPANAGALLAMLLVRAQQAAAVREQTYQKIVELQSMVIDANNVLIKVLGEKVPDPRPIPEQTFVEPPPFLNSGKQWEQFTRTVSVKCGDCQAWMLEEDAQRHYCKQRMNRGR